MSATGVRAAGVGGVAPAVPGDPVTALAAMGLVLPKVSPPLAAYVPAVLVGTTVYVSGQLPMIDGKLMETGTVGREVSVERAQVLARQCALGIMAAADDLVGLSRIARVVKVVGFVASAPGFTGQPAVINGASELFGAVFGQAGRHARSAVGVAELPLGAPVEIEAVLEVVPGQEA